MAKEEKDPISDIEQLFPGRVVQLEKGLAATVFPPGLLHIRKFSRDVVGLGMALADSVGKLKDKAGQSQALVQQLLPFLLTNALDLVAECVRVDGPGGKTYKIAELPHWLLPPILEAWVEESFGDEAKVRPWKAAIEKTVERATGSKLTISEMLRRDSSPPDTAARTSSSTASPAAPTQGGA